MARMKHVAERTIAILVIITTRLRVVELEFTKLKCACTKIYNLK